MSVGMSGVCTAQNGNNDMASSHELHCFLGIQVMCLGQAAIVKGLLLPALTGQWHHTVHMTESTCCQAEGHSESVMRLT